jgi:hypothetical protein
MTRNRDGLGRPVAARRQSLGERYAAKASYRDESILVHRREVAVIKDDLAINQNSRDV